MATIDRKKSLGRPTSGKRTFSFRKDKENDPYDEFNPRPKWSRTLAATVGILKTTLQKNKDNLARARSITEVGAAPSPLRVKITKLKIPRRSDVLIEGMDKKDAEGPLGVETMNYYRTESERIILYLHGGAYILGSPKTHRGITWRLSKYAKCSVFVVDYRLSPEAVFPLALHDGLSAFIFLVETMKYDPSKIVVMGDSAGGGLSAALVLWLRDHDLGSMVPSLAGRRCVPAGAGLLSPWIDLTHSMPSWRLNRHDYLPDGSFDPKYINSNRNHYYTSDNSQLSNPYVSPLFAKEDAVNPMPPLLIQLGTVEKLRDEILSFTVDSFPNSQIRLEMYDDMVHVFQAMATLMKISEVALQRLGRFTIEVTGGAGGETSPIATEPFKRTLTRVLHEKNFPERELTVEEIRRYIEQGRAYLLSIGSETLPPLAPAIETEQEEEKVDDPEGRAIDLEIESLEKTVDELERAADVAELLKAAELTDKVVAEPESVEDFQRAVKPMIIEA